MLRGRTIGPRPLQSKDSWLLHKWFNDQRVLEDLGVHDTWFGVSMERQIQMVDERIASKRRRFFIINVLDGDRDIGLKGLDNVDQRKASAELQIVIGEVDAWNRGYGREAIGVLLDHAFNSMNLHRVHLRVAAYNERAKSCYEACGFVMEGRLRHDHFHKGAYGDALLMSILEDEFGGRGDA